MTMKGLACSGRASSRGGRCSSRGSPGTRNHNTTSTSARSSSSNGHLEEVVASRGGTAPRPMVWQVAEGVTSTSGSSSSMAAGVVVEALASRSTSEVVDVGVDVGVVGHRLVVVGVVGHRVVDVVVAEAVGVVGVGVGVGATGEAAEVAVELLGVWVLRIPVVTSVLSEVSTCAMSTHVVGLRRLEHLTDGQQHQRVRSYTAMALPTRSVLIYSIGCRTLQCHKRASPDLHLPARSCTPWPQPSPAAWPAFSSS